MKIELNICGRPVIIEASGDVSVRVAGGEADGLYPAPRPVFIRELYREPLHEAEKTSPFAAEETRPEKEVAHGSWDSAFAEQDGIQAEQKEEAATKLFLRLAALRKELAAAAGVPPYVVFQDKALHEMAEKRPADAAALSAISGVGRTRLEKYGERFLIAIKEAEA